MLIRARCIVLTFLGFLPIYLLADETVPQHFIALTNSKSIQLNAGIEAIEQLDEWARSNRNASLKELKEYGKTRNLLFLMTHQARLTASIVRLSKPEPNAKEWEVNERQIFLKKAQTQQKQISALVQYGKKGLLQLNQQLFHSLSDVGKQALKNNLSIDHLRSLGGTRTSKNGGHSGAKMGPESQLGRFDLSENQDNQFIKILRATHNTPENQRQRLLPPRLTPLPKENTPNYFDRSHYKGEAHFLSAIGIQERGRIYKFNSVAVDFPEPGMQGYSKACSAFAITADMTYELNRKIQLGEAKNLDVEIAYARILGESNDDPDPNRRLPEGLRGKLRGGYWDIDQGITSIQNALSALSPNQKCPNTGVPGEETWSIRSKKEFAIDSYSSLIVREGHTLDPDFIRTMIDHKRPPMVVINTETRISNEDWIQYQNGGLRHIVNVVEYGEDIDPFDLKRKPYFLIRDSLAREPVNYKVDARAFMMRVEELHKIKSVKSI